MFDVDLTIEANDVPCIIKFIILSLIVLLMALAIPIIIYSLPISGGDKFLWFIFVGWWSFVFFVCEIGEWVDLCKKYIETRKSL